MRSRRCPLLRVPLLLLCALLLSAASESEAPPLALEPGGDGEAAPGVRRLALGERCVIQRPDFRTSSLIPGLFLLLRVALDELGPLVVHTDCTLRRITNWGDKTAAERAATQARVVSRNAARLAACREAEAHGLLPGAGPSLADADAEALHEESSASSGEL